MKTWLIRTLMTVAVAVVPLSVVWGAGSAHLVPVSDETAEPEAVATSDDPVYAGGLQKAAADYASACGCGASCGESCPGPSCGGCGGLLPPVTGCDEAPRIGLVGLAGFESFRTVAAPGYGLFGVTTGANAGIPIPYLDDYGIAGQIGGTYGVYEWDGHPRFVSGDSASVQQVFVTTGLFRKAYGGRRLSCGIVYDWMIADNWGNYGSGPALGQWRAQAEYAVSDCNAFGVWGTWRDLGHSQVVPVNGLRTTVPTLVENRAIDQINFFWHHKFAKGADMRLWVGFPETGRLGQPGSLFDLTLGGDLQVPLSRQVALYTNVQYMKPSASAGTVGSLEAAYDMGIGLVWYPGSHARSRTVTGACWTPYMPIANNSTFMVDQNVF